MSATPRPWKRVGSYIGSEEMPVGEFEAGDDSDFILRAVNAFDALLVVARAQDSADHRQCTRDTYPCDGCEAERIALAALDAAHPDWRAWA